MRTARRRRLLTAAAACPLLGLGLTACTAAVAAHPSSTAAPSAASQPAAGSPAANGTPAAGQCAAGARTLSAFGDHVYPDTGNGGYTSVHTDVHLTYDAAANQFLPGSQVDLHDRATQCLTSFSLDFERRSQANVSRGPDLTVRSVRVDGHPAAFRFVQPTYPGDPAGPDDPRPAAHEASQLSRVGGPQHNPLPPACSPELRSKKRPARDSQDGQQCPASKLIITPTAPIRDGAAFTVTVAYTGRPGVHTDGNGWVEGWIRSSVPAGDGGLVINEPVGAEDWMPLNDHPSAKPTYDFYDTVATGKTVLANGILTARTRHRPDAAFPRGSVTWHWHAAEPVASYLVTDTIGNYQLTERTAANGLRFYQAVATSLSASRQQKIRAVMNEQPDMTRFEASFNGPYPFHSDGVIVGRPGAGFEEEEETMIVFSGGFINASVLYHENMHQWWGDHVTEANYDLTFFKEGLATLGQFLFNARLAQTAAGGPSTTAGRQAFEQSMVRQFDQWYGQQGSFWTAAPSDPEPFSLYDYNSTYLRPGITYVALRQILGPSRFDQALQQIQRRYGGKTITKAQLEAEFQRWLPNRDTACTARLGQFFTQWFDTVYPPGGGAARPQITGPGLNGQGFYTAACTR